MKPEDQLPFDGKINAQATFAGIVKVWKDGLVPWETRIDEWGLCITTEPEGHVWVERALIRETLIAERLNPDDFANVHGNLVYIGGKVAAAMIVPGYDVPEGCVRNAEFARLPVPMRVGRFGGEVFVFLPREEFET